MSTTPVTSDFKFTRLAWRRHRIAQTHAAALAGGDRAFVFLLQRAGQHDVGVARGLAHEEVDAAEELQLLQRGAGAV